MGGLGHDVEISEDLAARLDELTGVDLLVVSDVLGHGVESYISAGHSALIVRSVQWLSRALPVSRLSMGEYREMSR